MIKLEHAVDGAPSQIPAQLHPQVPLLGMTRRQNENAVQYVSYLLFVRTQTKFDIKNL